MLDFSTDTLSPEEAERLRSVFEPLTQSVRELMDATARSDADADTVAAAKAEIESATARLRSKQLEKTWGLRFTTEGEWLPWTNAVVGLRNPVAPPLTVVLEATDYVWSEFALGAAYEGPPNHAHGGVCAMILDHVLGEVASNDGTTRFTGTINVKYVRPTPLGKLRAEARIVRTEGFKAYGVAHIADDQGVTIEAEGVFIQPKWARG